MFKCSNLDATNGNLKPNQLNKKGADLKINCTKKEIKANYCLLFVGIRVQNVILRKDHFSWVVVVMSLLSVVGLMNRVKQENAKVHISWKTVMQIVSLQKQFFGTYAKLNVIWVFESITNTYFCIRSDLQLPIIYKRLN